MEHQTDFIAFYEQLGLRPGCTLEELKAAYRRRVSALHPDRPGDPASAEADAAQLRHLTAAYTAATRFQRLHGRMPGGIPAATRGPVPPRERSARPAPVAAHTRRWPWFALAACAAIAIVVALQDDGDEVPAVPAARPAPEVVLFAREHVVAAPAAAPTRIEVGVSADDVLAIEGRPLMENAQRWDYGPSWIAFTDGKVSDWYSSRLRPLKVARARPPPATAPAR